MQKSARFRRRLVRDLACRRVLEGVAVPLREGTISPESGKKQDEGRGAP
jgi:hypothetical protein